MSQEAVVDNYVGQDKSAIAEAFGKAAATLWQTRWISARCKYRLLDKLPSDLSGLKVLDLGCGTGYFSEQLVKRGAAVVCADLSIKVLDEAKQALWCIDLFISTSRRRTITVWRRALWHRFL